MEKQPGTSPRSWSHGLPPVTAEIECGGQRHRITWRRGKLVLEAHDTLAERSLAALGSEIPRCVEVLDAWRRARGTERLYELLLEDRTISVMELELRRTQRTSRLERIAELAAHLPDEYRHRLERTLAAQREDERQRWDITLVEALPRELRRAMLLSVIVRIGRRWHDEPYRRKHARHIESALGAITRPLIEQSARRWRRNLKPYARFAVESRLLAPHEEPSCTARLGRDGAFIVLSLPLRWFFEVWARGLVVVDDCFVLGWADAAPTQASIRVTALRWERDGRHTSRPVSAPAIATRTGDGEWSLRWV